MPEDVDEEGVARRMPANSNVWTDGSLVLDNVPGASSAGHMVQPTHGAGKDSCGSFCSVPGPRQTVERAELWWLFLLVKHWMRFMLVWIILRWFWHVGRLLDGLEVFCPGELENAGVLLALVRDMIDHRGEGTVRIPRSQRAC